MSITLTENMRHNKLSKLAVLRTVTQPDFNEVRRPNELWRHFTSKHNFSPVCPGFLITLSLGELVFQTQPFIVFFF